MRIERSKEVTEYENQPPYAPVYGNYHGNDYALWVTNKHRCGIKCSGAADSDYWDAYIGDPEVAANAGTYIRALSVGSDTKVSRDTGDLTVSGEITVDGGLNVGGTATFGNLPNFRCYNGQLQFSESGWDVWDTNLYRGADGYALVTDNRFNASEIWTNQTERIDSSGAILNCTADAALINSGTFDNARINWAAPGAIGSVTPNSGAFTTISGSGNLTIATNVLKVDTGNDRVGIGTDAPGSGVKMHVVGDSSNNSSRIEQITNEGSSIDNAYLRLVSANRGSFISLYRKENAPWGSGFGIREGTPSDSTEVAYMGVSWDDLFFRVGGSIRVKVLGNGGVVVRDNIENDQGDVAIDDNLNVDGYVALVPRSTAPAVEGNIFASINHHLYYYDGSVWKRCDNACVALYREELTSDTIVLFQEAVLWSNHSKEDTIVWKPVNTKPGLNGFRILTDEKGEVAVVERVAFRVKGQDGGFQDLPPVISELTGCGGHNEDGYFILPYGSALRIEYEIPQDAIGASVRCVGRLENEFETAGPIDESAELVAY